MYIGYDSEASDGTVKLATTMTRPGNATLVEIQAETQNIRYRMDGGNPAAALGMLFIVGLPVKLFLIEDFDRIRFTQSAGGAGMLHCHFIAGRDI